MQIVVLAGGLATRLRPLTTHIPKILLPIDSEGRPFLDAQLRLFERVGIEEVILSLGYLGDQVEAWVRDHYKGPLKIKFVFEGEKLLGTGGALKKVSEELELRGHFLLTYGDSFLPVSFREVLESLTGELDPRVQASVSVYKNKGKLDSSNVEFSEDKLLVYDKKVKSPRMQHIDYGLLALKRSWIEKDFESGQIYDLSLKLSPLAAEGGLKGVEVFERFYEIGSNLGLEEFKKIALEQKW